MKLSFILGGLLMVSVASSAMYINMQKSKIEQLQVELQTAISNQAILESAISDQNSQIEKQIEREKLNQQRITELSDANNSAQAEVTKLRNTFARHDLNSLAIAKPVLIEKIVNRGTKKVGDELIELTNPRQFDEVSIDN